MVNAQFDFGIFLVFLGLGLVILFTSTKIGSLYLILSISMFIILGYALVTGYDVVLHKIAVSADGSFNVQEDDYLITNTQNNQTVQWLGFLFFTLALISSGKFVIEIFDKNVKLI